MKITKEQEKKIEELYQEYVCEILELKDIGRFAFRKTITDAVLNPTRTNETKVLTALEGAEYAQGDKLYFYFKEDESIERVENWQYDHSIERLLKKLHDTIKIFSSVYDPKQCPNYALKGNKKRLSSIFYTAAV